MPYENLRLDSLVFATAAATILLVLRNTASIRHRLYRLPRDPLVTEVLNPAFAASQSVLGAFGWFSSAWLASLSHGLAQFLSSPRRQSIRLIIAPALFPADRDFLGKLSQGDQWAIDRIAEVVGAAGSPDADTLERHAVECMGWMIQHGVLDVHVAIPRADSNYHPKIWLFDDGQDRVLVRGSANATARALGTGIEHMDVDCSWEDDSRISQSAEILNDWISCNDEQLIAVVPLPKALREALVGCAPEAMPTIDSYERACAASKHVQEVNSKQLEFSIPLCRAWENGKFAHQGEAVRAWEENGCRGLVEMATGAGKTVTALICAQRLHLRAKRPLLVVISAPTKPLVEQWKSACEEFGLRVAAAEVVGRSEAAMEFANALVALQVRPRPCSTAFVVTNHRVADASFQALIREQALQDGVDVLHVGDEAHGLGASGFRNSPRNFANFRLGLSATPMRPFDEEGTERLLEYFGPVVFRFGLERAIGVCLVPYEYRVATAEIQGEELIEFLELTAQIGRKVAAMGGELGDIDDESLTALLVRRRSIVENASDKLRVFRDLVHGLADRSLGLVYTSSKNPSQLEQAIATLASIGVAAARVTEEESSNRNQFDAILDAFKHGAVDMLVAKRVLDEGVDIPPVRQAIMLASSGVEREWIQRRGRILRLSPGKAKASIHDIIALPPARPIRYDNAVLRFISSELDRVRAFARYSLDRSMAEEVIERVHQNYF
jgi:superfamily II DNA or RNA helicase